MVVVYGLGVAALFAASRISLSEAGLLLGLPAVLVIAVLRPEWMVLVLVAIPPSLITSLQTLRLILILLAALFGFLLEGGLHAGRSTGIYPMLGVIVLAVTVRADTTGEAAVAADGMLKIFVYYTLLMLVAFQSAVYGRIRINSFVDALLIGLVGEALLLPIIGDITNWESINYHPYRGQFAYLAVMGFGVSYVRLSLGRSGDRGRVAIDAVLTLVFLCLTGIGFARTAWLACLLIFALVSRWTGRKSFWLITATFLVLVLTVPVVGERVVPGGVTGIAEAERLAQVTTGRSALWSELWSRGADSPLQGQGWGYVWTLSSRELFGFEGMFTSGENAGIFPHNDFLYLFVELGIIGFGLLFVYWLNLIRATMSLSRGRSDSARYSARVLVPVVITMFFVQLFGNGFAIRPVAERSFIAAGLLFGLHYVGQHHENQGVFGPATARGGKV